MCQVNRPLHLPTAAATRAFGRRFAQSLRAGDVLLLQGPIGAGKTTFLQGVATGLGITTPITSPTFVLHKQYPITNRGALRTLHHLDAYRLTTPQALLGVVEDLSSGPGELWAIEWGGNVAPLFQNRPVRILTFSVTPKKRRTVVERREGPQPA